MQCICDTPRKILKNTHFTKRKIELIIIGEGPGKGIAIMENNMTIASFDTNYCPVCGEKLYFDISELEVD